MMVKKCVIGFVLAFLGAPTLAQVDDANSRQEQKLRFIFITPCVNEGFFIPVKKGVRDAARMMDVECSFVGTEDVDNDGQIAMTRQAIKDGYDGIALNLIDPTAFNEVVAEAFDKGVPVVAFNVDSNDPANQRLSCVSQRLYEAGRALGERALDSIIASHMGSAHVTRWTDDWNGDGGRDGEIVSSLSLFHSIP